MAAGVVVLAVLAVTGLVLVRIVGSELRDQLERQVTEDLATVLEDLRDEGELDPRDLVDDLSTTSQVITVDGRVLAAAGGFAGERPVLEPEILAGVIAGSRGTGQTTVAGVDYQVAAERVPDVNVAVVVGRSVAEVVGPRRVLVQALVPVGVLGGLAVAGAVGLILQYGLVSLRTMTRRAESLEGRRLDDRLPVPVRDDEVARLARTINGLLERIEASRTRERDFTADAGHELRTPLAILRARLELTQARVTGRVEADLDTALDEVDRLAGLVEDLLALARADSGRFTGDTTVDVGTLARETAGRFTDLVAVDGIDVQVRGSASVQGDRRALERVLTNLVDNAARHANDRVDVSVRQRDTAVVVEVGDDGPGVPDAVLSSMFERFARAGPEPAGGAGLGLAIVAAVVNAHDGTVTAANRSAGGLAVTVVLPRAKDEPVE